MHGGKERGYMHLPDSGQVRKIRQWYLNSWLFFEKRPASCKSLFAKEPWILGLFCGKWTMKWLFCGLPHAYTCCLIQQVATSICRTCRVKPRKWGMPRNNQSVTWLTWLIWLIHAQDVTHSSYMSKSHVTCTSCLRHTTKKKIVPCTIKNSCVRRDSFVIRINEPRHAHEWVTSHMYEASHEKTFPSHCPLHHQKMS